MSDAIRRRLGVRPGRLLLSAGHIASPLTLILLGLVILGALRPQPALVAWLIGLALSSVLAWLRERRLRAAGRYLGALIEAEQGSHPPLLEPSDYEGLEGALRRLARALAEGRQRRIEADRLLEALLDAVPDPLLLVGTDRQVLRINRASASLLGEVHLDRPLEASLRDPGLLAAVDRALAGGATDHLVLHLPGPPPRAFEVRLVPVPWRSRQAVLLGLRELTEQIMIERMRSDFVANASHELRTPLSALKGFIETLRGAARDDPEAREAFLETMAAEAERMARLVGDLLTLSRIELSAHQPPGQRVDLAACLDEVRDLLAAAAGRHGVALTFEMSERVPVLTADRDQMVQLLTNLVDNAIKYGGPGEVRITCDQLSSAPPGAGPLTGRPAVRLRVSDHGPGVAHEHLPRLTERFFRVDPARSRKLGGTGLGLAIVKHILRRHRGHLAIESEIGRGTTVTAYLPAS